MLGVNFLSFSFIFFKSIVVYLKSGSRLTFWWTYAISYCLHLKYRCVPKLGSRLTFSSTFALTFLLTTLLTFVLTSSLTFSLACLLTSLLKFCWQFHWHFYWHLYWYFDWHFDWQGGGGGWGVDFFLKSNNPTPTGGEQLTGRRKMINTPNKSYFDNFLFFAGWLWGLLVEFEGSGLDRKVREGFSLISFHFRLNPQEPQTTPKNVIPFDMF